MSDAEKQPGLGRKIVAKAVEIIGNTTDVADLGGNLPSDEVGGPAPLSQADARAVARADRRAGRKIEQEEQNDEC